MLALGEWLHLGSNGNEEKKDGDEARNRERGGKGQKKSRREESEKRGEGTNFNTVVQLTSYIPNEFIEKFMNMLMSMTPT